MTRQDLITRTLMLEQVAAEASARAKQLREALAAEARAELEAQGTAPTWRLQDIGTVTLPVSTERAYVADEMALTEWVAQRAPDEVETLRRVRPAYLSWLLTVVDPDVDRASMPGTGEVVPGLGVRPGGVPQSLSFRPSRDAQAVARATAEKLVGDIEQALGGPVVLAERDA